MRLAHPFVRPDGLWTAWDADVVAIATAVAAAAAYGYGLHVTGVRAVSRRKAWSFGAGLALALLAVVSPLHAAAEASFTGHMVQHLVLMYLAAPMLVAGRPGLVWSLALPLRIRRAGRAATRSRPVALAVEVVRHPLVVAASLALALWLWHLPGAYQAAVGSWTVHAAEHASFLGLSVAFWSLVMRAGPRRRLGYGPALLLVAATMLQSTWLAAVLAFSPPAYPVYRERVAAWGMTPQADQQLAGTLMWVPPALALFVLAAVLFVRWLGELDARMPRYEARPTAEVVER